MSSTKGTRMAKRVLERSKRMNSEYPKLLIPRQSPSNYIRQISEARINQECFDCVIHLLETAKEVEKTVIANAIANNVCIGLDPDVQVKGIISESISEKNRKKISAAIEEAAICNRILVNESKLNKRFNVDKFIKDHIYRPIEETVQELCSMIDTYDMASPLKLHVALENIVYSLAKNNAIIESDASIMDSILEYFLMRDMTISDIDYKAIKTVVEDTSVLDKKGSKLLPYIEANTGDYFTTKAIEALSSIEESDELKMKLSYMMTEADAMSYIDSVKSYIDSHKGVDPKPLYYTIKTIPNIAHISKELIDQKAKEYFGDDIDTVSQDSIMSPVSPISEEDDDPYAFIYSDNKKDIIKEVDSSDIKNFLDKFKAEQDKSPSKVKNFLVKLHTRSPEAIIDDLPSIFSFVRAGVVLAIGAFMPLGPIVAGIAGFATWLVSCDLNSKQANKLLAALRKEIVTTTEKIEKSSGDKKEKLTQYKNSLKQAANKVESYLDNLEDEDHYDYDNPDDDDFGDFGGLDDLDLDFESAMILAADKVLTETVRVLNSDMSKVNMSNMIMTAVEDGLLHDFTDIVKESSYPMKDYKTLLEYLYSISKDAKIRTYITSELGSIDKIETHTPIREVFMKSAANNVIYEMEYNILNEKFNLNTLKLAIQNGKAKLRDLNTKQKSMWQAMDAHASSISNGLEKALTSDRREAIIKGSIVPSMSKCCKSAIALGAVGLLAGPYAAAITAIGGLAASKALNEKEKKLIYDEIETELQVVEKQIEIAQNDQDMNQYRFLLNYKKKLAREGQRIKYGLKVSGRNIPAATLPPGRI